MQTVKKWAIAAPFLSFRQRVRVSSVPLGFCGREEGGEFQTSAEAVYSSNMVSPSVQQRQLSSSLQAAKAPNPCTSHHTCLLFPEKSVARKPPLLPSLVLTSNFLHLLRPRFSPPRVSGCSLLPPPLPTFRNPLASMGNGEPPFLPFRYCLEWMWAATKIRIPSLPVAS